jgi:hypothetical protein
VRTVETSTLLDSGMDVYFPREVTESEEAAETGASPSRHRTSGSLRARADAGGRGVSAVAPSLRPSLLDPIKSGQKQ